MGVLVRLAERMVSTTTAPKVATIQVQVLAVAGQTDSGERT